MSFRLLIDECLSPERVDVAVAAGYVETTCARDRGLLLFRAALEQLAALPDLVNQALEVIEDTDGFVSVAVYEIPKG